MLFGLFACGLLACVGIVCAVFIFMESRRKDVLIIDDKIAMSQVRKFLNLTESQRDKCVGGRDNGRMYN
jgi:hypothetical protein